MCPCPPDSPAQPSAGSPDASEGELRGAAGLDRARAFLGQRAFPASASATGEAEAAGHVGLEPERFVLRVDDQGRPTARLPLALPQGT